MNEHQKNRKYGQYMDRATIGIIILILIVIGTAVTASIVDIMKDDNETPVPTETIAPETTLTPSTDETQQQ